MRAVAITDTGNMFGALECALAAAKGGVQPIIGCQLAIAREDDARTANGVEPDQLVVLVQSEAGYRNLLHLVSKSYIEMEPGLPPQLRLGEIGRAPCRERVCQYV